jgi:ElaB/YqjD/DUF883 family membrane-anchored ribosome-binding protein
VPQTLKKSDTELSPLPNTAERRLNTWGSRGENVRSSVQEKQKDGVEKSKKIKQREENVAKKLSAKTRLAIKLKL